jgi:pimeloyl-ACP methyl ester carboxylesterase
MTKLHPEMLTLPSGRRLAWEDVGEKTAAPILYCHGAPGSRLQRRLFVGDDAMRVAGVRVITIDRPGYGYSDFESDRTIEDWRTDVAAVLEHLGVGRFAVLGFSSGTPYALSLAASPLPVVALGVVSGDAPPREVADAPVGLPETISHHPRMAFLILQFIRVMARVTPGFTIDRGTAMLSDADRRVVADSARQRAFLEMLKDSLREGPRGMILDLQIENGPWRVRPPSRPIPIHIWHGEADADSPASIGRYLASHLAGAKLHLYPGEGHVSVFVRQAGEILQELSKAFWP